MASFWKKKIYMLSLIKTMTIFWQIHIYNPLFLIPKSENFEKWTFFSLNLVQIHSVRIFMFLLHVYIHVFMCLIKGCFMFGNCNHCCFCCGHPCTMLGVSLFISCKNKIHCVCVWKKKKKSLLSQSLLE